MRLLRSCTRPACYNGVSQHVLRKGGPRTAERKKWQAKERTEDLSRGALRCGEGRRERHKIGPRVYVRNRNGCKRAERIEMGNEDAPYVEWQVLLLKMGLPGTENPCH